MLICGKPLYAITIASVSVIINFMELYFLNNVNNVDIQNSKK